MCQCSQTLLKVCLGIPVPGVEGGGMLLMDLFLYSGVNRDQIDPTGAQAHTHVCLSLCQQWRPAHLVFETLGSVLCKGHPHFLSS